MKCTENKVNKVNKWTNKMFLDDEIELVITSKQGVRK